MDRLRAKTWLGPAALWGAVALVLSILTAQVADWYVMTDELLYERLALSIVQLHSPLPHVHGELIGNVNQLYPLLLAPIFAGQLVPSALHQAHVLNALVMSSACLPAYLLSRRLGIGSLAYGVAAVTVLIPWIALSSFLMTETVAYPAFLWAVLALHATATAPSRRNDLLLLAAVGIAILARAQFVVLLVIIPVALLLASFSMRRVVREHRVLAATYGVLGILAVALLAAGELSHVLGTYSVTAEGNVAPRGMPKALLEHLAPIALGIGVVPFVLGGAWLLTNVRRNAFACIALVALVALLLEVASYDLRFGAGRLHDRYLFYVVPLMLIAFAAQVRDVTFSRWALIATGATVALALAVMPVVSYHKFNVDSPVAFLNEPLLELGGSARGAQLLLSFATIAATVLVLAGRRVALVLAGVTILAAPAETAGSFARLLGHDGTSGRPLTLDQGRVFDWLDRKVGRTAAVTMIPYPILFGTYWENVSYWWNVEFWNASVRRAAVYETAFTGTPETFPTTQLTVDRRTGRMNASPTQFVVRGVAETRFHISGRVLDQDRGAELLAADMPWRADWVAFDFYRDGWTIPKITGTIRVFPQPGQGTPERRYITIYSRAPKDVSPRPVLVRSNTGRWRDEVDANGTSRQVSVCVPPHAFADVHVSAPHYSPIYGDPRSEPSFVSYARSGGVLLTGIALADEVGAC